MSWFYPDTLFQPCGFNFLWFSIASPKLFAVQVAINMRCAIIVIHVPAIMKRDKNEVFRTTLCVSVFVCVCVFPFFRNSFTTQLRSWSWIRKNFQVSLCSIGSNLFGKRQPCLLTRQFSLRLEKQMFFPIQCCVWCESVQIPSKHGRRSSIGFWIHVNLENWIESTVNRRSSSGKISQDSLHWKSSLRFKRWWLTRSVNLSNSKEELFSCQCITTLNGDKKWTEKPVLRILFWFQSMLDNSREGIGRFLGLEQRRSGTELTKTNKMENGTMSLRLWRLIWVRVDVWFFDDPVHFERGDLKSKGKGKFSKHFNGSDETVEVILRRVITVNQLSVNRAAADMCGELALETMVMPPEVPTTNPTSQTDAGVQGKLLRDYEQKFAALPEPHKLTKLCSNAGFSKNIETGHFFTTLDDDALDDVKGAWEGGFSETWKSARSWMSVIIMCWSRTRQTSPYSLCAECAAGCPRAASARRGGRSAAGSAWGKKGEQGRRETLTSWTCGWHGWPTQDSWLEPRWVCAMWRCADKREKTGQGALTLKCSCHQCGGHWKWSCRHWCTHRAVLPRNHHILHTFAPRKHVIRGVVLTHPVGYSRPLSAVNDPSVTK